MGIKTSDFKIEIGTRFKDAKRDITIIDRKYIQGKGKYYKYKCNICRFDCDKHYSIGDKEYKDDLWTKETYLLKNGGCSCCFGRAVVQGINDIYTTDKWMIPIINDDEFCKTHTHSCSDYIYPTCSECGRKRNTSVKIAHLYETHSMGCSCSNGVKLPNKLLFNILEQLLKQNNYIMEYSPKWCKYNLNNKFRQGSYDSYFKLNNKEYIIEMDGGWHKKDNNMSGQTADESKKIDNYKDRLAVEHNFEVIRIDCNYGSKDRCEYIKNNILKNSKLNELFNLSEIDWLKAEEFTLSNLVKIVCEFKRNNPNLTTKDIGDIFGYKGSKIRSWLKQGDGIWCTYNVENEIELRQEKAKNAKIKQLSREIICLNDGKIFDSAKDCQKLSIKYYNCKITSSEISAVCNGKRNQTKGFQFKFTSDLTQKEIKRIQENAKLNKAI